jgi:hypothetical protein
MQIILVVATPHSIAIVDGTTVVCSFNGIYNAATGISIINNTVQNATILVPAVYAGFNVGLS